MAVFQPVLVKRCFSGGGVKDFESSFLSTSPPSPTPNEVEKKCEFPTGGHAGWAQGYAHTDGETESTIKSWF